MKATPALFATALAGLMAICLRIWQSLCGILHAVLLLFFGTPRVRQVELLRWPRGRSNPDGQVIFLCLYFTAGQVRADLANAISREARTANQHQQDSQYWGQTGAIEWRAIDEIQDLLLSLRPVTAHGGKFAALCHAGLGTLLDQWRASSGDPDGFGLGTIHSVRSVLEWPGNRDA